MKSIKASLCSVPVEGWGVRLDRKRSEGSLGIQPKVAIVSLVDAMKKAGFPNSSYDFYDIDRLYPSDDEVRKYFVSQRPDVVGLSAVVSTSYKQVKRLAKIIRKVNKNCLIVCGGYLTAASNTVLRKTKTDVCVVGDGEIAWVGILNFMKKRLSNGKDKIDIEELLKIKGIAVLDNDKNLLINRASEFSLTKISNKYLELFNR